MRDGPETVRHSSRAPARGESLRLRYRPSGRAWWTLRLFVPSGHLGMYVATFEGVLAKHKTGDDLRRELAEHFGREVPMAVERRVA